MPAIDFTDIPELEPVPEGRYEGEIVKAEVTTSRNQNPMINLNWQVLDENGTRHIVFDRMVFSTNALWRVKRTLKALGFEEDFKGEVTPEDLVGLTAVLVLGIEKNRRDEETDEVYPDRNIVQRVLPAGSTVGLASQEAPF